MERSKGAGSEAIETDRTKQEAWAVTATSLVNLIRCLTHVVWFQS